MINDDLLNSYVKDIPKLPQRQDSVYEQLQDLIFIANRLGCYDAADFINNLLINDGKF